LLKKILYFFQKNFFSFWIFISPILIERIQSVANCTTNKEIEFLFGYLQNFYLNTYIQF
jgi:hypothetical protein